MRMRVQNRLISELDPKLDCFDFLNRLQHVVLSSNLGDNRTLAIPVAHTIYHEMGAERRASMGIADSLIRVSVGIEDPADLLADFQDALPADTWRSAVLPSGKEYVVLPPLKVYAT